MPIMLPRIFTEYAIIILPWEANMPAKSWPKGKNIEATIANISNVRATPFKAGIKLLGLSACDQISESRKPPNRSVIMMKGADLTARAVMANINKLYNTLTLFSAKKHPTPMPRKQASRTRLLT